jgi:hypothetical protein
VGHIAGKETIRDEVHTLLEHAHTPQLIYPPTAGSVTITAAAGAWTHGGIVQVVPASTINSDFDIHWVLISALSANAEYEIILYSGAAAAEVEIGRCGAARNAVQSQEGNAPMMTALQPAGTRISASLASDTGVADTADIKLYYHEY